MTECRLCVFMFFNVCIISVALDFYLIIHCVEVHAATVVLSAYINQTATTKHN